MTPMNPAPGALILHEVRKTLCVMAEMGCRGFDAPAETLQILARLGDAAPQSVEAGRTGTLEAIRADLGECTRCPLHQGRTRIVFGEGSPRARLVFVGEGPGFEEDRAGRPFVGPAGQLLTRIIQAIKLTREQVYICNIVKCRPPRNRNPEPGEIRTCIPFLERQIAAIHPQIICTLGGVAAQALLGTTTSISRLRGRWHEYNGIPVMPTFHPAFLLRNPDRKRVVWEDMKMVMRAMGTPI